MVSFLNSEHYSVFFELVDGNITWYHRFISIKSNDDLCIIHIDCAYEDNIEEIMSLFHKASDSINKFYEFPDWYEMDKAVVKNNMICDSRNGYWTINDSSSYILFVRLYMFDENERAQCEYLWLCFPEEESAKETYYSLMSDPSFQEKNDIRLEGKNVALNTGYPELDSIMQNKNYKTYSEITKNDVIEFVDGSSWGHEVVYR